MSVLTLGLYDIFWMFKQWSYIRSRDESSIRPFWRALFSVFFIKSLFSEFKAPNGLAWALVYYGLALCSRLPGNWAFITLLEVLPLYALQSHINDEFNVRRAGGRYSKKAVTVCVLGGLIWVLVVIGTIWT